MEHRTPDKRDKSGPNGTQNGVNVQKFWNKNSFYFGVNFAVIHAFSVENFQVIIRVSKK